MSFFKSSKIHLKEMLKFPLSCSKKTMVTKKKIQNRARVVCLLFLAPNENQVKPSFNFQGICL